MDVEVLVTTVNQELTGDGRCIAEVDRIGVELTEQLRRGLIQQHMYLLLSHAFYLQSSGCSRDQLEDRDVDQLAHVTRPEQELNNEVLLGLWQTMKAHGTLYTYISPQLHESLKSKLTTSAGRAL